MLAQGRTLIGETDGTLVATTVADYIPRSAPLTIETGRIVIV